MGVLSGRRFNKLTAKEKRAYAQLKAQFLAHAEVAETAYLPNVSAVIEAMRLSEPELYFINWNNVYSHIRFNAKRGIVQIRTPYLYTKAQRRRIDKKLEEAVGRFKGVKSKRELARVVHDHLANTVTYDTQETLHGKFKFRNHSVVGALLAKRAVCEGISKAYQLILTRYGVDCMMTTGRTKSDGVNWDRDMHGWNIVALGGEYYHVDVTWDLKSVWGDRTVSSYAYYCVPTRLIGRDHEMKEDIPCDSVKENLFYRADRVFCDEKKLYAFFKKGKKEEKGRFVMIHGIGDERLNERIAAWCDKFNRSCTFTKGKMNVWYIKFYKEKYRWR